MAQKLIILTPLRLKGTNVTIHAKELYFEGTGQIDTTPDDIDLDAMNYTSLITAAKLNSDIDELPRGENGANGFHAGSITTVIREFFNSSSNTNFVMSGGKGQNAGSGLNNENGKFMDVVDITNIQNLYKQ